MQVKKFEARSMKEALEMVKTQLGPEAIILNVRDNKKSFGLVGEGSIEITAAVSEETLRKKSFVESRIREEDRQKLQKAPARTQKDFIERMVSKKIAESNPEPKIFKQPTSTRYIDIVDDNSNIAAQIVNQAEARIKDAAQRAWSVFQENDSNQKRSSAAEPQQIQNQQIANLQQEIATLKNVILQFQSAAQNAQPVAQHPGAEYGLSFSMSTTFSKLKSAGVSPDIAAEILTAAQKTIPVMKQNSKAIIDGWAARQILDNTLTANDKAAQRIQIFVGPPGSGKTSTLVKIASHLLIKEKKKIALATMDTRKVGAVDQLRIYSQILNVPFVVIRSKQDWGRLESQLAGYDCILVDSPGLSLKNMEEISFLDGVLPEPRADIAIHLVLSSLAKDLDLSETVKRYRGCNFRDAIFTSIDASMEHGHIFNFVYRHRIPLHSFGIGPNVPEDLEFATKERLLDLIFKLTKHKSQFDEVGHAG